MRTFDNFGRQLKEWCKAGEWRRVYLVITRGGNVHWQVLEPRDETTQPVPKGQGKGSVRPAKPIHPPNVPAPPPPPSLSTEQQIRVVMETQTEGGLKTNALDTERRSEAQEGPDARRAKDVGEDSKQ